MAAPAAANAVFDARRRFMAPCALAWSPACCAPAAGSPGGSPDGAPAGRCSLLAVATQSGHVQLWRWPLPSLEAAAAAGAAAAAAAGDAEGAAAAGTAAAAAVEEPAPECLGAARVHGGSVTALTWAVVPAGAAAAAAEAASSSGGGGGGGGGDFFIPRRAEAGDLLILATGG
jgi:hypothetical protein